MFNSKNTQWKLWFRDNLDNLMHYARWRARSEEDAQDIIQSVFEEGWNNFRKSPPQDIHALICHKIRQRAIDYYRSMDSRSQREKKYGQFTVIDSETELIQQFAGDFDGCFTEDQEIQKFVIEKLSELDQQDQEIITLYIWNKLSYRKIAQIVGLSKSVVADRYQQAISKLHNQLKHIEEVCNY